MRSSSIITSIALIAISVITLCSFSRSCSDSDNKDNFLIIGKKEYSPFQAASIYIKHDSSANYIGFMEFYNDDNAQESIIMFCSICSESDDITKPGIYNGVEWKPSAPPANPVPLSPSEAALFPEGYVKHKPSPDPISVINTFDVSGCGLTGLSVGKIDYFQSGIITITKSGNRYSISFDCLLKNGEKLVGNYRGKLRITKNEPDKSAQPIILDQFIMAPPQ